MQHHHSLVLTVQFFLLTGTGTRGAAARSLSTLMQESGSFFVEVVIDMDTTRHIVFQSNKIKYKHGPPDAEGEKILHTHNTIGECSLFSEKCVYRKENVLKNVCFDVCETQLRALIIGFSGIL